MSTNGPNSEFRTIPLDEKKFLSELIIVSDNDKEGLYTFKTLYMLSDFVKLYKAFKNLNEKSSTNAAWVVRNTGNYLLSRAYNTLKNENPDVLQKFETMLQIYRNNNNNNDSFEGYQKFVISIIDILAVSAEQQIHNFKNLAYNKPRTTKFSEEDYIKLINKYSSSIKEILNDKGSFILKAVYKNNIVGQASISSNASELPGGRRFNKTRRKKQNKKRKRKYSKKR